MDKIIGRKREIEYLDEINKRNCAQLVVVYGRRRIGKTFLINEYYDNTFCFKITGINEQNKKVQLQSFVNELYRRNINIDRPIENWFDAFYYLRNYLSGIKSNCKQVVFFDEMPWLDTRKSGFKAAFENFWNDYGCTNNNLIFIVCGSSSSWMLNNVVNNKGGLFNRHTARIFLESFNLCETEQFLKSKNIFWSRYDIVQCYMIMGGVPFYLNMLSSEKTLNENIDNLFFRKGALLWDEYDKLYNTLFLNDGLYKKIVEVLYNNHGINRKEISTLAKVKENGLLTKVLEDLFYSGFIKKREKRGDKKEIIYYLCDYYSIFYLKFIKEKYGKDENYWQNSYNSQLKIIWCGINFEHICFDHIKQIKKTLGISGVLSNEYSLRILKNDEINNGAQIDLIIDRKDNVVSICEIKYSINEFTINKDCFMNIQNKISSYINSISRKKTIQLVFITTFGVSKGEYRNIVNKEITMDDLFIE